MMTDTDHPQPWRATIRDALIGPGKVAATVCAALPTLAFVGALMVMSLRAAAVVAGVTALGVFGYRILVKQPVRPALIGFGVAALCVAVAAFTGDARGFFIAPVAITAVFVVANLASIVVRRPLAGVLLNRLAGGPPLWHRQQNLMRLYTRATLSCVAVNVVITALQVYGYVVDSTALLAVLHIVNPIIFTVIIAVTVAAARKTRSVAAE